MSRTVKKYTRFVVDDSAGTLREVPIDSINGVGLDFPETDLTAFQDAVRGVLTDTPDSTIEITGPLSNDAAVAASTSGVAPALSGSHTVLNNLPGGVTPLSLGVYLGMSRIWQTGDPVFGLTSSATSGFLCTNYTVNPAEGKYSARFKCFPGSSAPAWGTAAVT